MAILESIEGPTDVESLGPDDAPLSPPLSEWHCEDRSPGLYVALGVGRLGKSHWSAAVAADIGGGGSARLSFDIACRAARRATFLGSQYRSSVPCRLLDPARIELLPEVVLTCDPATTRLTLDEATGTVVVEPLSIDADASPRTIQWRYWFACARRHSS